MLFGFQDVDARDKRGHDESVTQAVGMTSRLRNPCGPDPTGETANDQSEGMSVGNTEMARQ
jgi:hypothetical protein